MGIQRLVLDCTARVEVVKYFHVHSQKNYTQTYNYCCDCWQIYSTTATLTLKGAVPFK